MADELTLDEPTIGEGDVLCERYRADRLIERNELGTVIAATDLIRGGGVAIKMIEPEQGVASLLFARLRREAHILSQLTSPHVVRVFDIAMHGQALCVVMELLQGLNMARYIRRRGALSISEAVGYVVQACDGLADAHAAGIVHRDVKPQNLFLADRRGGTPIIKVLDFGVSKQYSVAGRSGLTMGGAILGSPPYSSPEQLRDPTSVDPRADIWSIGLVLYFLLCKRNAFEAETFPQLLIKIATQQPPSLSERRPDVPEALEEIFLQCVEKEPEMRFQDMAALARALAPFAPSWSESFLPSIDARIGGRGSLPSLPLIPLEDEGPMLIPLGPADEGDAALPAIIGVSMPAGIPAALREDKKAASPDDEQAASPDDEQAASPDDEQAASPDDEQAAPPDDEQAALPEGESDSAPPDERGSLPAEERGSLPAEEPPPEGRASPVPARGDDRRFLLFATGLALILVALLVILILRRAGHPVLRW